VTLYKQIGEDYKNGKDISNNPTVGLILQELQKRPEWQTIMQQASVVYKKHKIYNKI
jgi:hypothetical protein